MTYYPKCDCGLTYQLDHINGLKRYSCGNCKSILHYDFCSWKKKCIKNGRRLHLTEWIYEQNYNEPTRYYICLNCNIVNFHPMSWCYKCGTQLARIKLHKSELRQKFSHYKCGI